MKYGVRECCDVVLKAKATQKVGNKIFYKNEPVIYFDTLKTSAMEGSSTTVYAQGGKGNARLMSWSGERQITWSMEDALISPEGFMILSGAGLVEPTADKPVYQHVMETTDDIVKVTAETAATLEADEGDVIVYVKYAPYLPNDKADNYAYVMIAENGEPVSEPIIPAHTGAVATPNAEGKYPMVIKKAAIAAYWEKAKIAEKYENKVAMENIESVIVDYYVEKTSGVKQIEITPDKFGGSYYLEASTLWRDTDGVDYPAEFIIPNCRIQSSFNFSMSGSGDPQSFSFTLDAFPDYTRFDKTKKVLAQLQVVTDDSEMGELVRTMTPHDEEHDKAFVD